MNSKIQIHYLRKYRSEVSIKTLSKILMLLFSVPLMIGFSSCSVGLPTDTEQTDKDLFVDMGSFSVSYPPGDDWSCEADKIKKIVTFTRYKRWLTGQIMGSTIINIFANNITSDTFKLGEKETAKDYVNEELQIIKEDVNVKKGKIELEGVFMFDTVINNKKFYCMHYNTSWESFLEGDNYDAESILALYFPPNYSDKREFYVFGISDSKISGTMIGQEMGQLYAVLKSFVLK